MERSSVVSRSRGGGSTRNAAVRGALSDSRFRSPATTRIAASATVRLEGLRDIGNRLGADRLVGDQQRRQLGDLGERGADRRGVLLGTARSHTGGAQRTCGVLCDTRQRLGKLQGR